GDAAQRRRRNARCRTWLRLAENPAISRCHDSTRLPEKVQYPPASKEIRATPVHRLKTQPPQAWFGLLLRPELMCIARIRRGISSFSARETRGEWFFGGLYGSTRARTGSVVP